MCKYLCPLGKQQIEASFSARGEANSARSRLNLNLRMWSKMFVSFNFSYGSGCWEALGSVCWVRSGPQAQRLSFGLVLAKNQTQSHATDRSFCGCESDGRPSEFSPVGDVVGSRIWGGFCGCELLGVGRAICFSIQRSNLSS